MKNIFEEMEHSTESLFEYFAEIFRPLTEEEIKKLSSHQDEETEPDNSN